MTNLVPILITSIGLLYSIYLLISSKFNTKDKACNSCICLYGIGWMFLLLQTVKSQFEGPMVIGLFFLLSGFLIWSRKQLKTKRRLI